MTTQTENAKSARNIFLAVAIFTIITVLAVIVWGAVALAMAALFLVPIVFILLLAVTRE